MKNPYYALQQLATSSLAQKLFILSQVSFDNPLVLLACTLTSTFAGATLAVEFYKALPMLTGLPPALLPFAVSEPLLENLFGLTAAGGTSSLASSITTLTTVGLSALALNYIPPLLHLNNLSPYLLHLFFLPLQFFLVPGAEMYYALGGRDGLQVTGGMVVIVAVGRVLERCGFGYGK